MKATKKAAPKNHYAITVDGRVERATPLTLPEIASAIGCHTVELVRLPQCEIWCDEEAALTEEPINDVATRLLHEAIGYERGLLRGNVYVVTRSVIPADASERLMCTGTIGVFVVGEASVKKGGGK